MLIVEVHAHVKSEYIEAFKQATIENARHSYQEPGIARFDVLQRSDDPNHFVLWEIYRNAQAPADHKETSHYIEWRETVAKMMAEPRTSNKYSNIYPDDQDW